MKLKFLLTFFTFSIFLTSCFHQETAKNDNISSRSINGIEYPNWELYYDKLLSDAKSPVILVGKDKSLGCYGITVKTGDGQFITIGNLVGTANTIGNSREIGDTIK